MKTMHMTREGKTMAIPQMDDSHLHNFISLVLNKALDAKNQAEGAGKVDAYTARLYGMTELSMDDAADITREALERLAPYLIEAYLRGLEGPRVLLRDLLGREKALPADVPMLPVRTIPYDDPIYDDDEPMPSGFPF